ncbi:MAG: hypothetical protein QOE33_481 [Acidobacteriota bacterium]|nr:hypothetical protein [Acidobacteriota bacterium]
MNGGTLVAHCGARKITREELTGLPMPGATRTHQPLAHHAIVEALIESLSFRHISVVRDEYAVTPDGLRMFGVMDLDLEYSDCRFSIGLRNSNDKSMRLALTAGYRVFVCDNMAFAGEFTPILYKHTRKLDLVEVISVGVDRIQRNFTPLREQISEWQARELLDEEAKLLIYQAFVDRELPLPRHLLPKVHEHYFAPTYEAFRPRTLWSLANAFTSAFKELKPVSQFMLTAKLGSFLSQRIGAPMPYRSGPVQEPAEMLMAAG